MKAFWLILGVVIGIGATVFVYSSPKKPPMTITPDSARPDTLSPWQLLRVELGEPAFFNQYAYLAFKYRIGLNRGWYKVRAWVEETTGENPSSKTSKKIIDYGMTKMEFTNPELLIVLPTEEYPGEGLLQVGGGSIKTTEVNAVPNRSGVSKQTSALTVGQIQQLTNGKPIVLYEEVYGTDEKSESPYRSYRLLLQIDSTPNPNAATGTP